MRRRGLLRPTPVPAAAVDRATQPVPETQAANTNSFKATAAYDYWPSKKNGLTQAISDVAAQEDHQVASKLSFIGKSR